MRSSVRRFEVLEPRYLMVGFGTSWVLQPSYLMVGLGA